MLLLSKGFDIMGCAGCEDCTLTQIAEKYLTPFEIHVTVDSNTNIDEFKRACNVMGIKPLIIANVIDDEISTSIDIMTRSTVAGDSRIVMDEILRVEQGLNERGFEIVRRKAETVPWAYENLKDFSHQNDMPYFETHIEVTGYDSISHAYQIAKKYGGYVSWNVDKWNALMITFRLSHVNDAEFSAYTDRMRDNLLQNGLIIGKKIVELTIHDDNKSYDDAWVNAA